MQRAASPISFSLPILAVFGLLSLEACRSVSPVIPDPAPASTVEEDVEPIQDGMGLLKTLPSLNREFRGVWIATVDNIDWPSEPGLTTGQQQAEMRALLDRAVDLRLNAVVFQVRATADAFYDSPYEPWSAYLTGVQGQAPDPYYDPLEFAIEEAHRRGIELHAWFNPFRAYHPTAEERFSDLHVSRQGLTVRYGSQMWMDPGNPMAIDHSVGVIMDVVDRYDIDGVHMDDYFYPYPVQDDEGQDVPFPDDASWAQVQARGEHLPRDDWRRQNVDRFIRRIYRDIKSRKPWVKFGISPFGIWRPGFPEQITGFDAYEKLYADARKWLNEGWVDYFTPQLYWSMDSEGQSYPLLLDWWIDQNTENRHMWPGNFTSRIILDGSRFWTAEELISQIEYTRSVSGAGGNVHFSMKALMPADHRMGDRLATELYGESAVVPASPWLSGDAPAGPDVSVHRVGRDLSVTFRDPEGEDVWLWAVRTFSEGAWTTEMVPGWKQTYRLFREHIPAAVAVSAVNRTGIEGPVSFVWIPGSSN